MSEKIGFTLSWQQPKVPFDIYSALVYDCATQRCLFKLHEINGIIMTKENDTYKY